MAIFSNSRTCPTRPTQDKIQRLVGTLTFQHLLQIIGWVCLGVTISIWSVLVLAHLRRYKVPNEQRQIWRIVSTPLVFAVVSIISLHAYGAADYLEPLANLYEAYALASLFLLYVQYVVPSASTKEDFFVDLPNTGRGNSKGSLRWFWRTWRTVFLYVVIYTALIVIQEITKATGTYCSTSSKPRFAHVWLQALELITTVLAIVAVIRFQRRLRECMTGRRALSKLVMFKLFVLVTTIQHFVFSILKTKVTGNPKVSYDDITIGLSALLICIEAVICMAGFYVVFNAKEYSQDKGEACEAYSVPRSFLDAINPMDLLRSIGEAFGSSGKRG